MYKSLLGIAAAAVLALATAPQPAEAAPIRHAPGLDEAQIAAEPVRHRRYHRHWRAHRHWHGPRVWVGPRRAWAYGGPYPYYAYAHPYPYYHHYHHPGAFISVGPFGFGFW
jgi:hypothetical protein